MSGHVPCFYFSEWYNNAVTMSIIESNFPNNDDITFFLSKEFFSVKWKHFEQNRKNPQIIDIFQRLFGNCH